MEPDNERLARIDGLFQQALDLDTGELEEFFERLRQDEPEVAKEVAGLVELSFKEDERLSLTRVLTGPLWEQLGETAGITARPEKGERIGAYRVVKEIGRGGMAVVYLAERADGAFDQEVALKLLQSGADAEDLFQRFEQERQILASLSHPAIARLLDGGLDERGRPFIVLEYIEGEPLDTYCDRRRLGIEERIELFLEVAKAVRYAHRQLVVHRDLKPSNILVTADGEVKLLDFGIAKLLDPASAGSFAAPPTRTITRRLTPEYASPEQVRGEPVSTASDVYQLGLILYELLTGERAYRLAGTSAAEAERVICFEIPVRPSTAIAGQAAEARQTTLGHLSRRLRGDLDTIVLRALSKEPERRYPSPSELIEDLERYRSGRPVAARPDTVRYRAWKFLGRHRFGLAAAAVIALLLVGYAVTATLQARQIAHQRDRAQAEAAKAQEVKKFLLRIFEVSDPDEARGSEITARQLLDQGSGRIEDELAEQPELQAELFAAIGEIYRKLGSFDRAEPFLSRAVALQEELEGEDPGDATAESLHFQGRLLRDVGELERAEEVLRRSLELRRRTHLEPTPQVAEILHDLALVLRTLGRYPEAEASLREALEILRGAYGDEHEAVAGVLATLSTVRRNLDDLDEAEVLGQEALAVRRKVLPVDHPDIVRSLADLGQLRRNKGDLAGAEALFREALEARLRILGPEHPSNTGAMNNLAVTLMSLGKPAEAEPILRKALEIRLATLDSHHPLLGHNFNNLGQVLQAQGRLPEAQAAYQEAIRRYPEDNPWRAATMVNLATALEEQGDLQRAEELYRQSLELKRQQRGEDHSSVAISMMFLGRVMARQGRYDDAEPLLVESLRRYRESFPAGHLRIAQGTEALAEMLVDSRRFEEALPLWEETLVIRRQALEEDDPRVVAAREARDRCQDRLGR